jgi:hypothetical protein
MTDTSGQPQPPPEPPRDLTKVGKTGPDVTQETQGLKEEKYNLVQARENVRGQIAMWLVWSFVGFIAVAALIGLGTQIGCAVAPMWAKSCDAATTELKTIRALVELILTPLVGLVGAVSGFYFGEKSANSNSTS